MGQGLGGGAMAGTALSLAAAPARISLADHLLIAAGGAGLGLGLDFASDCLAKNGKIIIERDVVLKAEDIFRHLYTFRCPCESNAMSKFFRQKHEWLVLESRSRHYYTVQKSPASGDVMMNVRTSLRSANDIGLVTAGRPAHTGEIRQFRSDMEFDMLNGVQVAYMIAWLRKEDPRWAFSTENSAQFAARARIAVNDF